MTKAEKIKLRKAIELLANDEWDEAMDILFPLAGKGEFGEKIKDMNYKSVGEIMENSNFKAPSES